MQNESAQQKFGLADKMCVPFRALTQVSAHFL